MARNKGHARAATLKAHQEIEHIEHLFSEEDSTSEIYRFNHAADGIYTNAEVYHCVLRALDYHQKTNGAFDITTKPLLDLYGFQSDVPSPPTDDLVQRALANAGVDKLEISHRAEDQSWWLGKATKGVSLAMGGIVKGYAVDRAIQVLRENQIEHGIINAGGDLYCFGAKSGASWLVGVQHPRKPSEVFITLALSDLAVATSGDYQRYFFFEGERYHHILDPQTGKPARKAQSATVIARTTEEADAWATALFVLGPDEGIRLVNAMADIYGLVVDSSGTIHYSKNMQRFILKSNNLSITDNLGMVVSCVPNFP